jgi:hypothetical protein
MDWHYFTAQPSNLTYLRSHVMSQSSMPTCLLQDVQHIAQKPSPILSPTAARYPEAGEADCGVAGGRLFAGLLTTIYIHVMVIQFTPSAPNLSYVGMDEVYPRTILELEDCFATEDACCVVACERRERETSGF